MPSRRRQRHSRHDDAKPSLTRFEPVPEPRAGALRRTVPDGWWQEAFTRLPSPSEERGHPCGHKRMIAIVAYDITDSRRLQKIGKFCMDWGVRVQYSVFECRLPPDDFEAFWSQLRELIDPSTDRIVAYKICASCSKEVLLAGTMVQFEQHVAYVF